MKKYTFLVHHSDYVDFLHGLRHLGVLHVQYQEVDPSEELEASLQLQKDIHETLHALRSRIVEKDSKKGPKIIEGEGLLLVESFRALTDTRETLKMECEALEKEIDFLEPWGGFSIASLDRLEQAGLNVHFFICPIKKYQPEWADRYALQIINRLPPDIYFVILSSKEEKLGITAEEVPPPPAGLNDLRIKRASLQQQIDAIDARLDYYAEKGLPALEQALQEAERNTRLVEVIDSTQKEAGETLMLLKGFVPVILEQKLIRYCEENRVLFFEEPPTPEDHPPVLLKNSFFSRLFEPIGQLFSLPDYRELDLTPFFAPFFMLFFGFCLGDAGYGLVVLLAATLYKFRAKSSVVPVLTLVQFLGSATIFFGILTGTVFGVNLLGDSFSYLGDLRTFMLDSDQTFRLALVLGMVQILFGLVLKAVNLTQQYGFRYAIATYGWIVLLLGLLDLMVLKQTGSTATYAVWSGIGIILLFNDPKAGILTRLGKGIWELYGITGIFGDLLSYIRLFALGISSAILGFVINDISLQIRDGIPHVGQVLFILFLLVGHALNLLISSLGAFVHPMRLTFVEFYKNAGFTGGGKPYEPFSSP